MPMAGGTQIGFDLVTRLKETYSTLNKTEDEKLMSEIHALVQFSMDRRNPTNKVLDKVARLILKEFEFKSVSIGVRGEDGMYRYVAFGGHPKEAEDALRMQKYDIRDMLDYDKYPNIRIGAIAQFNPVEGFPDKKDELVGHHIPSIPSGPRGDTNSFLPGDYIDVFLHGTDGKLIGWIELLETKNGRLPPRESIRWIELIGDVSAALLQQRMRTERE